MYPFSKGSFAPEKAWYVAGFSDHVGRKPIQRMIAGKPMALYRKEGGTVVAVGGRCPHRHFPLGEGMLNGDDIVCGYHGIQFGPDGKCTKIPSQDFVPKTYAIPTYTVVEHGMWIFVWPGDPALADVSKLPDLEEIRYQGSGLIAKEITTRLVDCRYQLLNDNLLDLSHLVFLHQNTIGSAQNATEPEEVEVSQDGVLHTRRHLRDASSAWISMRWVSTPVWAMCSWPQASRMGGRPLLITRVFHAITPATRHSSYYFFAIAKVEWAEQEVELLNKVIDQDVFASVEIEKLLANYGDEEGPRELMLKSDHATVQGRRMLQAMIDAERSPVAA